MKNKQTLFVTVALARLLKLVSQASLTVERKTTIPILANLKLEATNKLLVITGTDLDVTFIGNIDAVTKTKGACTVPAKLLHNALHQLPKDPEAMVQIVADSKMMVSVFCGSTEIKMFGMAAANFPVTPAIAPSEALAIDAQALAKLIRYTSFAINKEKSRYAIDGALMEIRDDAIMRMVTTDGHRLAVVDYANGSFTDEKNKFKTLVPSDALKVLATLLHKQDGKIDISVQDEKNSIAAGTRRTVYFHGADWTLSAHELTGTFPNYDAVIPRDSKIITTFDAKQLHGVIKRVSHCADDRSFCIKVSVDGGKLTVSASDADRGSASEVIKVACDGSIVIGYNYKYVLDILNVAEGKLIAKFKDNQSSTLFMPEVPEDRFERKYVLMPMRI